MRSRLAFHGVTMHPLCRRCIVTLWNEYLDRRTSSRYDRCIRDELERYTPLTGVLRSKEEPTADHRGKETMTDLPEPPQRPVRIEQVQFAGDELVAAVLEGEGVAVPTRLVCTALGLDPDAQAERLREHDVLARALRIVRIPLDGRMRSVLAILHTHIAYWLATIPPNLVSPAARPKLIRYQEELVVVLNALYGPVVAADVASTTDQTVAPAQQLMTTVRELRALRDALLGVIGEQRAQREDLAALGSRLDTVEDVVEDLRQIAKISAVQAEYVQRAIKRIATRHQQRTKTERNMYELLFAQFKIDMGIPRYDALPAGQYDKAIAWLQTKAADLLPDDPDALPPHQEQLL